ncbi:MAG: polysaccharide export protein [Alphaproteobacteria bacterium]|nr:MAG: polysaccharide export protein [Alphaproteobacteria bacterium]
MAGFALGGCSLPRGAAMQAEILSKESVSTADMAVYRVGKDLIARMRRWPAAGGHAPVNWPTRAPARPAGPPPLRPGDTLKLTVWDNGDNSLITAPGQRAAQISAVRISPDGSAFLPYVGRAQVAGLSPDEARSRVEEALATISPSAQVQLEVVPGPGNSVEVVSGVANPGTFPLTEQGMTVLDAIAAAGGAQSGLRNPQVRLVRGSHVWRIPLADLVANPRRNIPLEGRDRIAIEEDGRYFLALGAAGTQSRIDFTADRLTAAEALTMMGGVSETRADPKGVLILRSYPARAVDPSGRRGPEKARVAFVFDLTTADGLFSAAHFPIASGDIVLATESPVAPATTLFGLIQSARRLSGL